MKTVTYRIQDIATVVGGGTPSTANDEYWNGDVPWISPADLTNYTDVYIARGEKNITELGQKESSTQLLPQGTVLLSSRAPIGYLAIAKNPICTNQGFKSMICDETRVHNLYLYHYIKQNIEYFKNYASGSTFPELSGNRLKKVKITICGDVIIQHRIASILSAYDELIEKNNRKIAILQERAQELYKEWFVRFRFPCHETTKFENGLPQGWKTYRFSEKVDIMSGGTPNTENDDFYGGNIPFYTPKDSSDSIFAFETITNISQSGLEHCNSQLYPKNTIMVTARGTVGKTNILAVSMAMNQSCYALKLKEIDSPYFLYFSLCEEIKKLKCVASGGVFDTIIVKTFNTIHITIPTKAYINNYNSIINPIMESICLIEKSNCNLTRQRDLLLPRLMSGKLEIN